ncbi:DUF6383 domain-containing protein [Parabacteroides gordonii]|uniref:DUF6383 domain-containing protein n=1 Tax=Parabacteroides gordonii MS-1 = DSM 23371 TaxID=1203610 RepID=A0A0F5JBX4_9BACT|nr:DUF6383 domain-containing protein [Parabacteroides gordonii]KKB55259.1 hypothetical protein HMPREF1536_02722 [Parabacteroides gordonii MS-1 = DSM 23371]MCA5581944.1 DUF6383 domain-containing protein [Parabacteroides gordonii]RGP17880.1 hypothetical protein DXB27_00115 [Parabacteroides gordonii]
MNKKFSTLVAVLLAAGAWTTLDARVIEITAPKVNGSYLIGSDVTEGDGDNGKVATLLKVADGTSAAATAAAVESYGSEWTLEAVPAADFAGVDVTDWFYLKAGGKYLIASTTANQFSVEAAKTYAVPFVIKNGKFVVAKDVTNTGKTEKDKELTLVASGVTTATINGTALAFGQYTADENIQANGSTLTKVTKVADDNYYFVAATNGKLLYFSTEDATTVSANGSAGITAANIDQYLWKPVRSASGEYSFENKAFDGKFANIGKTKSFNSNAEYNGGVGLYLGSATVDADFTAKGAADAPIAFGFYKALDFPITAAALNNRTGNVFDLTFKVAKDSDKEIVGAEAFAGSLIAVDANGNKITTGLATKFQIKSGDNYIVLVVNDKKDENKNVFKTVTADELADDTDGKYYSWFEFSASTSTKSTDVVSTIKVGKNASLDDARTIILEDNLSEDVAYLRTRIAPEESATYPYITLTASNMVDYKDLLGKFMSISFLTDKAEEKVDPTSVIYKKNGILSTVDYDADGTATADYVNKNSVLSNTPEVQWAITDVNSDKTFTLTNRESGKTLTNVSFRQTGKDNVYKFETVTAPVGMVNDTVEVKLFANDDITKFDGFRTATPNELRNQKFHIGQYHNETQNAVGYWAENHQTNGTHQLGVVADEDAAGIWNLRLDQKVNKAGEEINEVDTVFITTTFYTEDAKGNKVTDPKKQLKSVLAVLPYEIQNRANLEYVKFLSGNNLNYYACNEEADTRTGFRFALKAKPNGYSIVTLPNRDWTLGSGKPSKAATALGNKKIDVANSVQWGALKQRGLYEVSDNSIMVVTELGAPEYRKVVKEWGDTVRIYRDEYPTEVLFEKRDAKSIVDKDTLSFLNVNNSVTGANPALFVDTAYVNRVDADGVANTCYQYLLAVNVDKTLNTYCPDDAEHNDPEWIKEHGVCPHAIKTPLVKGRFLINLVDTAFAYKQKHLHNNPYVNMVEAGQDYKAKLSFVEGIHVGDTLYLTRKGGEAVKLAMDSSAFNVAKFAFRYVNNQEGSFKIQTRYKEYSATSKEAFDESANDEGYLRWINGTIVVTNSYLNGETFNMEENFKGNPVANEDITTSSVKVTTTEGKVIIAGAQGKKVTISNVLGQTVANAVLSSDKAEIATPSGVVIVAVEGEAAVKAIVK